MQPNPFLLCTLVLRELNAQISLLFEFAVALVTCLENFKSSKKFDELAKLA